MDYFVIKIIIFLFGYVVFVASTEYKYTEKFLDDFWMAYLAIVVLSLFVLDDYYTRPLYKNSIFLGESIGHIIFALAVSFVLTSIFSSSKKHK